MASWKQLPQWLETQQQLRSLWQQGLGLLQQWLLGNKKTKNRILVLLVCVCVCVCACVYAWYKTVFLPAMVTEGERVVVESGLEVSVREGVVDGAWVGEAAAAVLAVVLTLLELTAAVAPTFAPVPAGPAPATRRGLSSDCWMIFTPSGLLHDDSLVRAL